MRSDPRALKYLQSCPSLGRLPCLEEFAEICEPVSQAASEEVFREAAVAEHLYLLCSGMVRFTTQHQGGKEITFGAPLEPGHFFGEVAVLSVNEHGDHRRTASCVAVEPITAVQISWKEFKTFITKHPECIVYMELLATDMATRLRRSGSQLARFELYDPNKDLQPKDTDKKVRSIAKLVSSVGCLAINTVLILATAIVSLFFKEYFDRIIGVLGCVVTVEALLVTILVLNSQDREAARQETRVARQYANVNTTLEAVAALREDLKELRAERALERAARQESHPLPPGDQTRS